MSKLEDERSSKKTSFFPMAGGIKDQFGKLLKILRKVRVSDLTPTQLKQWLEHEFDVKLRFAINVYTVLLQSCGLVEIQDKVCRLSERGEYIADTSAPIILLEAFRENFMGFDEMLVSLQENQPISSKELCDFWKVKVADKYPTARLWKERYFANQFRHRLDWLRSMNFVENVADEFLLSRQGLKTLTLFMAPEELPESEKLALSHNELEQKIKAVGEFFQFEAIKRPSVNKVLPNRALKLKEDRQLDCLWVRVVHFGGKVQYPIEIQLGGNIADTIERLEIVCNFAQKALIITDREQQDKIVSRLKAKRSLLLDKAVFLEPEDIDKIVEATNIMRSFTRKIFED